MFRTVINGLFDFIGREPAMGLIHPLDEMLRRMDLAVPFGPFHCEDTDVQALSRTDKSGL